MKRNILMLVLLFVFCCAYDGKKEKNSGEAKKMETNIEQKIRKLAEDRYVKEEEAVKGELPYIKAIESIKSDEIKEYLTNFDAYRVSVYNPWSVIAGPGAFYYSILTSKKDGTAYYIEDEKSFCDFISSLSKQISNFEDANKIVNLFGQLRSYILINKEPQDYKDIHDNEFWTQKTEKNAEGWVVETTFLTDPAVEEYVRFRFNIKKIGEIEIIEIKNTFRGGYR